MNRTKSKIGSLNCVSFCRFRFFPLESNRVMEEKGNFVHEMALLSYFEDDLTKLLLEMREVSGV